MTTRQFIEIVWSHYRTHGRHDLPWRHTTDPYHIMVSEIMLQQTQVDRVIPRYQSFIRQFPTLETIARATLKDVLILWQGLGYNRRAAYLKRACEIIVQSYKGDARAAFGSQTPLPGIGPYTRGAIRAFAWDEPTVLIETNVRAVYLHHFFKGKKQVRDKDLLPYIAKTLDSGRAREWYWALMDYGAHLKRTVPNPSRTSKHHTKQSRFAGSNRELRAQILRALLVRPKTVEALSRALARDIRLIETNLLSMKREGLLESTNRTYRVREV